MGKASGREGGGFLGGEVGKEEGGRRVWGGGYRRGLETGRQDGGPGKVRACTSAGHGSEVRANDVCLGAGE